MQRYIRLLLIILITVLLLTSCSPVRLNPRYKQLFLAGDEILALQTNGAVERVPKENGMRQLVLRLPASDDGNGIILNGNYYYVKGRKLVVFPLHNRAKKDMYTGKNGEVLRLHLVSDDYFIISKAFKPRGLGQRLGEFEFYGFKVANGEIMPLNQKIADPKLSPVFLVIDQDKLFFTNTEFKLGVLNLSTGAVSDLSAEIDHNPTQAVISNDVIYLIARHQAFYAMPLTGQMKAREIDLSKTMGLPGAIATSEDGILLSLEDDNHNAAIYKLSASDYIPVPITEPDKIRVTNLSHLLGYQDKVFCLSNEGKKFEALPFTGE